MRSVCVIEQDQPVSRMEASAGFVITPGGSEIGGSASPGPARSLVVTLALDHGENKEVQLPAPMRRLEGVLITASAFDGVTVSLGGGAATLLRGAVILAGPISDLLGFSQPGTVTVVNNAPEPRSVQIVFLLESEA